MKLKKSIIVLTVIAVILLGIVGAWMFRDFDAQGYVKAILDQNFKGEVETATEIIEGKTEEELYAQYEDGIVSFVENNIAYGIDMDEESKQQYIDLCKEIFKDMKYEVKEAEKISRKEYQVPVEYCRADVFQNFVASIEMESERLMQKVEKGEYQGTVEEINAQMQQEFLTNVYELFKTSYTEMQYAEPETMIFNVTENEDGLFTMSDDQIYEFVTKIMGLDEIMD